MCTGESTVEPFAGWQITTVRAAPVVEQPVPPVAPNPTFAMNASIRPVRVREYPPLVVGKSLNSVSPPRYALRELSCAPPAPTSIADPPSRGENPRPPVELIFARNASLQTS